jgi:hypothetical protein
MNEYSKSVKHPLKLIVTILISCAAFLAGCSSSSQSCSQTAWYHKITITLKPPISTAGAYDIRVVGDGLDQHCSGSLKDSESQTCSSNMTILSSENAATLIDIGIIQLSFGDWEEPPSSFELSITDDAGSTSNHTVTPNYTVDEPNGAGCGERKQVTTVVQF